MTDPKVIRKVGLAVFRDGQVLTVRSHGIDETFYFLGGKVEEGESDEQCVERETQEELGVKIEKGSLKFLSEFEDWAHGRENTRVNIRLYTGRLVGEPKPLSEIAEMRYVDSSVDQKNLSAIAINHIFPWLRAKGLIK